MVGNTFYFMGKFKKARKLGENVINSLGGFMPIKFEVLLRYKGQLLY